MPPARIPSTAQTARRRLSVAPREAQRHQAVAGLEKDERSGDDAGGESTDAAHLARSKTLQHHQANQRITEAVVKHGVTQCVGRPADGKRRDGDQREQYSAQQRGYPWHPAAAQRETPASHHRANQSAHATDAVGRIARQLQACRSQQTEQRPHAGTEVDVRTLPVEHAPAGVEKKKNVVAENARVNRADPRGRCGDANDQKHDDAVSERPGRLRPDISHAVQPARSLPPGDQRRDQYSSYRWTATMTGDVVSCPPLLRSMM